MSEAIVVRGLTKRCGGKTVVDHLDLSVQSGTVFGLLGTNGAGKSTAIECMLGTRQADAGTVRLLGQDPKKHRRTLFERIGVQFQEGDYHREIKVSELCEETACLYRDPADWRALCEQFGIGDKANTPVKGLSGGERQRLFIVLALIPQPELELGRLYGLADPSKIQSFYSVGIVLALFVSAALLKRKVEPAKILVAYPTVAFLTLAVIYFVQKPAMCLAGGFLLGFFAAGGVLQLVTAVANEMFPKNRGVITSIVMISSSLANYIVISVAGVLTRVGGANGPRLVVLFNMAVTLLGIVLALYLNVCQKRERAAKAEPTT